MAQKLTEKYRPKNLSDVIGQDRLVADDGILTRMLSQNRLESCIFYGPPGCGKTTVAKIVSEQSGSNFAQLNATTAKLDDIRKIIPETGSVVLYLDEIQYFSKKQQQSLLSFVESGKIILIAATTDNPYHCCYDALLSRCTVLEFKPVHPDAIKEHLLFIAENENRALTDTAANEIAARSAGDVRRAVNMLDMLMIQSNGEIGIENVKAFVPHVNMSGFDMDGDEHYSLISGLQKSIRGSDPNAALFYLARLLEGGDILSPCRRLLVIANEDIGFGNPWAVPFVYACVESAKQLGLPEAKLPLTNAVICLAISQKCSTAEFSYANAEADVLAGKGGVIPIYLRHACGKNSGYLYPHNYPNHWVEQEYMPDDLKGSVYYTPGDNAFEQRQAQYWQQVKDLAKGRYAK